MKPSSVHVLTTVADPDGNASTAPVISYDPGAVIDLAAMSDMVVLAFGAGDEIDLYSQSGRPSASGDTVTASGNNAVVNAGGDYGNDITLLGRNDTVSSAAFPGSFDTIRIGGTDDVVAVGGNNTLVLSGTGTNVTILATQPVDSTTPINDTAITAMGSGTATATGAGNHFSFIGGSGGYVVNGGAAMDETISGGAGGGVFTGGYYDNSSVFGGPPGYDHFAADDLITAGLEASTLVGGLHGSSVLTAAGSAHDVLVAGEYGQDTLSGGSATGNNLYQGYAGTYAATTDPVAPSLVINAGSGNDTLVAGIAAETLTGGSGRDQFRFDVRPDAGLPPGGSRTLITDFTRGTDKIDLLGFSETARQVVASATVSGGSTFLVLSGGVHITLADVTHLSVADFTHG